MFNEIYEVVVKNSLVEEIKRMGRCEKTMAGIFLDRAYKFAMEYHTDDIKIFNRSTGKEYVYNV